MLRVRTALLTCLTLMVSWSSAQAGWHEFWHRVHLDFHRNQCWPEPFSTVDQRASEAPFVSMVHSGWRMRNTLGKYYFHHETNQLTEAGERKLYWILTNSPEEHKAVYVVQSIDPYKSDARLDSVQQALARLLPDQPMPAVLPTTIEPRGLPAEYVDTIDRKSRSTIPDPRLPAFRRAGSLTGG